MHRKPALLILVALVFSAYTPAVGTLERQATQSFDAAGTNASQVEAFLKTLQAAVSIDNRLKVASLVEFPLEAWAGGEKLTIRNESEFQARYSRVVDASLKKSIGDARLDALLANQTGVMFDGGRFWVRPIPEKKNALRIVAINEPGQTRR